MDASYAVAPCGTFKCWGTEKLALSELVGSGSLGTRVFKASYRNQVLVVRRVGSQYSAVQSISDLRNDLAVLAAARHPNLLRYFGFASDAEGNHAVLMEFVYSTLERQLGGAHGPMTWNTGYKRISGEISGALRHLHARGLMHGQLHPGNVMLDRNMRAKLSDFGRAHVVIRAIVSQGETDAS